MRPYARLVLATLLSLVFTAGGLAAVSPAQSAATWTPRVGSSFDPQRDLDQFESRILVRINRARSRHDLGRVRVFHACVDSYSERWSRRLKRIDDLVHRDLSRMIDGCHLNWVGETLVSGTGLTPRSAVRAWLNSPPHRAVILKRRARWAGVGVRVNRDGKVYAALNFADRT